MAAKKCQICDKPSGIYPLCKEHLKMSKEGKVIKGTDSKWILVKEHKENSFSNCIICNNDSNGKALCYDCYSEAIERKDEFDKNQKPFELKDYYFNLKSNIYRINNFEYVKSNVKKMVALAYLINDIYKDSSLINRYVNDVEEVIKIKIPKKPVTITSYTEQSDSQKSYLIRTNDGHIVKSNGEMIIDNILYNLQQAHSYEKEVTEIPSSERTIKSDFYIPYIGNKGIYIEYWGMNKDDYQDNKSEKRKLYKEYNIPLIEVEKDDVKDQAGLTNRIEREILSKKEELKKTI